jgi:hypothetical protein
MLYEELYNNWHRWCKGVPKSQPTPVGFPYLQRAEVMSYVSTQQLWRCSGYTWKSRETCWVSQKEEESRECTMSYWRRPPSIKNTLCSQPNLHLILIPGTSILRSSESRAELRAIPSTALSGKHPTISSIIGESTCKKVTTRQGQWDLLYHTAEERRGWPPTAQ